jgi:hypothetical protein
MFRSNHWGAFDNLAARQHFKAPDGNALGDLDRPIAEFGQGVVQVRPSILDVAGWTATPTSRPPVSVTTDACAP